MQINFLQNLAISDLSTDEIISSHHIFLLQAQDNIWLERIGLGGKYMFSSEFRIIALV